MFSFVSELLISLFLFALLLRILLKFHAVTDFVTLTCFVIHGLYTPIDLTMYLLHSSDWVGVVYL